MHLKVFRFLRLISQGGISGLFAFKVMPSTLLDLFDKTGFVLRNRPLSLSLPGYKNLIWYRYASSDIWTIRQIFIENEYKPLNDIKDVRTIIDLGANAGYSAVYFLNRYSKAKLIAVEPDPDNLAVCRKNLESFADRSMIIDSGIWSHRTGLKLVKHGFGNEWSTQVQECRVDDQPDLMAIDLRSIIEDSEFDQVDILKIDIEGTEKIIFAEGYQPWLDRVKNLAIEIHSDEDKAVFHQAMNEYSYDLTYCGELTICKNISRRLVS